MYRNGTRWCTEVVLTKSICTEMDQHCTEVDMYRSGPHPYVPKWTCPDMVLPQSYLSQIFLNEMTIT